jgi:ribosomal protein S18 acetylase RimI-like enzyme
MGYDSWDSSNLDITTFEVSCLAVKDFDFLEVALKKFVEYLDKSSKEMLFLKGKCDTNNFSILSCFENAGFNVKGLQIELSYSFVDPFKSQVNKKIRFLRKEDTPRIKEMAKGAFIYTHLYNNKFLNKSLVDEYYANWANNCCSGRSDAVLVFEEESLARGFIACNLCKNDDASGRIDLIAVSKEITGKGVGTSLVLSALSWFRNKNVDRVLVKTEAMNYAAIRMYNKAGFVVSNFIFNLHYIVKGNRS